MGSLISTIESWIKVGRELAARSLKWIWECVSALFTKISQLIQRVLRGVMSCFSYSRERTWTYCGPTQVEVSDFARLLVPSGLFTVTLNGLSERGTIRTLYHSELFLIILICSLDVDPLLSFCRFSNIAYEETG